MWAMTDFTEENGATRVIPASHRFDDRLELDGSETVPAEMEKGSVLLYTGSLYHGAGANRSTTRAAASTSPTAFPGSARRRTSISPCRSRSRAPCRSTCCD